MADDVRESKLNNLLSTRGFKDLRSGENRKQRESLDARWPTASGENQFSKRFMRKVKVIASVDRNFYESIERFRNGN